MSETIINELVTKTEEWKQTLQLFENDNIRFKTALAKLLGTHGQDYPVDQFEHFQNRFLKMDGQILLLRHELREQQIRLQADVTMDALHRQADLLQKFSILHNYFSKLNTEFANFLLIFYPQR
jgi:hypothetical protein